MQRTGDALERIANVSTFDGLEQAIIGLRDTFDIEHIVYHSVKTTGDRWGAITYKSDWVDAYIEQEFHRIDPVVINCFRRFTPTDWKQMDWKNRSARELLAESISNGVGNQGVTLPVRGPGGQFAILTFNDRASDTSWKRFTGEKLNNLILIGHYVNERAIALEGQSDAPYQKLSPRETDTLTLLACGLSRGQISERLKISESTLRVYIESARFKLGAVNTVHAVANAVSRGLVCI